MGQHKNPFTPLEPAQARELEFTIDEAAKRGQAVIIDPERGITGRQNADLISPSVNTNGLLRYGRHYQPLCW